MKKSSKIVSQKKSKNKQNFKKKFRKRVQISLVKFLMWKHSIACFIARITCGLLSANGVWLKRIAQASDRGDGNIKVASEIKKIERFFNDFNIDYCAFSSMLYAMLNTKGKLTIMLDRTNWDFGKKHINIFVITVLYQTPDGKSFAIPLVWEVFDKKGNSNTQERKDIVQRLLDVVGRENIECVLGDREFIGEEWTQFLAENKIPFILRIKKNMFVQFEGKRVRVDTLTESVAKQEKLQFNVTIYGVPVHLAATRSKDDELVVVIASDVLDDPLNHYHLRWLIELFFKSIKSQGFKLEETHMSNPAKIKKLFALIALATLYAVQAGIVRHYAIKRIPIKNHGRAAYSLFTYGLDFLRALFSGEIPSLSSTIFNLISPSKGEFTSISSQ